MAILNGNGRIFWTWAGPIVLAVSMAAIGFIVAGSRADVERLDVRTDRLEEARGPVLERLSRIEAMSEATRNDVREIRQLLESMFSDRLLRMRESEKNQ